MGRPAGTLPDQPDGTLEDWEQVIPEASLTHNDWRFPLGQGQSAPPVGTDDIAMRLFMAWHNAGQQIYVGAEFLDDIAGRDDFQFMVDGDHSGGAYLARPRNVENLEAVTQAQYYYNPLHPSDISDLHLPTGVTAWAFEAPWFDVGLANFGERPTQTILEMKLTPWDHVGGGPAASQRTRLAGGNVIGFQLNFADFDPRLEGIWVIGSVSQGAIQSNASLFADAELIPCDILDCSRASTVVTRNSWGRIKASFKRD